MYPLGQMAALRVFGVKHAFDMADFAESLKTQLVGHPEKALKQFRKGTLFHKSKGLIAKALPKSPMEFAAAMGWPLMGTALLYRGDPDMSGEELAGDFAGRAAGQLLGGPLGAVGQIGGNMLLGPVGQSLGKGLSSL